MVSDKIADELVILMWIRKLCCIIKTLLFSVEKLSYYTDFMKKTHISYWNYQFIRCDLNIDNHDFYSVTGTPRIVQYCTQLIGLYK